eukprot:COSAG06_NODE_4917_length_3859_cov_2.785638_3_plen_159_part_00
MHDEGSALPSCLEAVDNVDASGIFGGHVVKETTMSICSKLLEMAVRENRTVLTLRCALSPPIAWLLQLHLVLTCFAMGIAFLVASPPGHNCSPTEFTLLEEKSKSSAAASSKFEVPLKWCENMTLLRFTKIGSGQIGGESSKQDSFLQVARRRNRRTV